LKHRAELADELGLFFAPSMAKPKFEILYEDNHLVAMNKPPGLATQGAAAGLPSLVSLAKEYIKQKYHKPGNVYLGVVSRLDTVVSGVVVFARTSKAAARLTRQFRQREVTKVYWAIVSGSPPASDTCDDWLTKDEVQHRMQISDKRSPLAAHARLTYRRLKRLTRGWLLEVTLETGRKHQIRVQLSSRDLPILGDRKYGSREAFSAGIALHSRLLKLVHPTRHETLVFAANPPAAWRKLGTLE
jgi:23S rRNA pseudouridine1911/1915/1917 synthase